MLTNRSAPQPAIMKTPTGGTVYGFAISGLLPQALQTCCRIASWSLPPDLPPSPPSARIRSGRGKVDEKSFGGIRHTEDGDDDDDERRDGV